MDWAKLRRSELSNYHAPGLPRWLTIPVLPMAVMEFTKKSDDPDASAAELGRIIETDNGLTSELLREVNSSAIALRHKASTAQRAIAVLGIHRAKLSIMNAAFHRALDPPKLEGFDGEAFRVANLQRAFFAQVVAGRLGADEDVAFAGAMLSDAVLPLLATHNGEFYERFRLNPDGESSIAEGERQDVGFCHAYAVAQIAVGWGFPDDLICCILLHHTPLRRLIQMGVSGSAVVAVRLAALLPDWFGQEPSGLAMLRIIEEHFPNIELDSIAAEVDELTAELLPLSDTAEKLSEWLHRPKVGVATEEDNWD